ncbi:MAG TPA: ATP-binding protein [Candidatus Acidoferrum sp.]|nr:ATP-binding protein [Candidatus Acidoferrum sp.]
MRLPILAVNIAREQDVVNARQRARQVAELLGFDGQDQTRIATALSEIARNAFRYAKGGRVEFTVEGQSAPQVLLITVRDSGPGIGELQPILHGEYRSTTGMGLGMIGAKRLMDAFDVQTSPTDGTVVSMRKLMPRRGEPMTAAGIAVIVDELARQRSHDPLAEVLEQNQELLRTLEELQHRQDDLERLSLELEDTNRGVVALYAELDEKADHLRRADELKSKFLSNMSHEFRTPLNSILALSRLLLDHVDGPLSTEQERQVAFVRKAAEDLFELVNDLLDLAKVEAGKIVIRPVDFDVGHLFGALRGMLRPLLVNSSLSLIFEDAEGVPTIQSDEAKVSQILRNFISNALKFTEAGEIRVSARMDGPEMVVLSVSDTGIGIAPADRERIFEEFTQLDSPAQRRVHGTGLGLPLTRKLAGLLGGHVTVDSAVGVGSTFFLTLPLVYHPTDSEVVPRRGEIVAQWEPDGARLPVLVVEDDPAMMLVYQRLLRGSVFQMVPARSLVEARQLLRILRPRVIILDVVLGGEQSWDFLAELRTEDATRGVPVLVVTQVDEAGKALALGAAAFGRKPIERRWLLDQLRTLGESGDVRRVLIIDDNEAARYLMKGLFRDRPFVVSEAVDGEAGLELARAQRPSVIFCDLHLPGMSGMEVVDALESDPATRDIPVIINTVRVLTTPEREELERRGITVMSKESLAHQAAAAELRRALVQSGVEA